MVYHINLGNIVAFHYSFVRSFNMINMKIDNGGCAKDIIIMYHAIMRSCVGRNLGFSNWPGELIMRERGGGAEPLDPRILQNSPFYSTLLPLSHFPSGSYITYCICIVHTKILNVTKETFC